MIIKKQQSVIPLPLLGAGQQGGIVGLNRAVLLQPHLLNRPLINHRLLKFELQNEVSCAVLHSRQHVGQGDRQHVLHIGPEDVVELGVLAEQVLGSLGELFLDLPAVENADALAQQQVHEGTHQHLRLVVDRLQIQQRTVDQLHHLPEHLVGILVKLLEQNRSVPLEDPVVDGYLFDEVVPLLHHLVGQTVKSGRVQPESQSLNKPIFTIAIWI